LSTAEPWVLAVDAAETPVADRARFEAEAEAMLEFHAGWALLATCHRVELYGMGPAPRWPDVMTLRGRPAARRLLRVAAGLESAVVGEDDVLRQVRDALAAARSRGVDERLARLFEVAIATGRKARAGRSQEGPGLAARALAWLDGRVAVARQPVLVAGTGRMGTALARAATEAGAAVTVVGRDRSRASLDLVAGAAAAPRAAAVAVALGAPWKELGGLADRLPPVADLSSPPAVPEPVREALGGDFLGIDGLYARSGPGPQTPWAARAAALVEESADDYTSWLAGRGSVQILRALQAEAEQRRMQRLERLLNRLPNLGQRERELISVMSEQLVTDLLHEPLSALRADSDGSGAEAARRLFRLS
jgi:glutamyl-tRNA reductase